MLWWDGGLEENLPARFDLAYSLRASDWHGSRQAQLEFIDFRVLESEIDQPVRKAIEVIDYRNQPNQEKILTIEKASANVFCWAEADEKKRVGGQDRNELIPAETLILWTSPSSRKELLSILEKVHPDKVLVFGIDPGFDEPKAMLDRLAGLVNFVLKKKAGQTSLSQLAAALAQGEMAVRLGLEWLSIKGSISLEIKQNGDVIITTDGTPNLNQVEPIFNRLLNCLEESRYYRKLFRQQSEINLA